MLILVVSDFHVGKGRYFKNGQLNILEDFVEDDRWEEFLEYYGSGKNYWAHIHLILNGDILNLIQIDVDGVFHNQIDEELTINALNVIYKGHPKFFESLKKFVSRPNKKITYIIGNHDAGMAFEGAQKRFNEILDHQVDFCFNINLYGVHIEHGQRFEPHNTVPMMYYFKKGPQGKKILNLPWGSQFCINHLPRLRKERPHIDKIRPKSVYIKWCVIHDTMFAIRIGWEFLKYFIKNFIESLTKQGRGIRTTLSFMKQGMIYPRYAKMAKRILRRNPFIHTVIMGHIHLAEWRRYSGGKYYFNSGTWNPVTSVDVALHENMAQLYYVAIDVYTKTETVKNASLNIWQGKWRPYREEVTTVF